MDSNSFSVGQLSFLGVDTESGRGQRSSSLLMERPATSVWLQKSTSLSGRFSNWCDEFHLKLTKICLNIRVGFRLLGGRVRRPCAIFPVYRLEDFRVQFKELA